MDPQVQRLLDLPQFVQRSPEWFEQRNNAITASDIPTVLNENKYKTAWSLLMDKCNKNPKPFVGNDATRWGTHYEDHAIELYSSLREKKVLSFGLIIHPAYPWLGGSPDGITTDGILLEVKCPLRRKIVHGEVPAHYLSQILLNMEICNLEIGHFIEYIPGDSTTPMEINIVEIKRDREWFERSLPVMKAFWDDVLKYREIGLENHPRYLKYKQRSDKIKETKSKKVAPSPKEIAQFIEDPDDQGDQDDQEIVDGTESVCQFVDFDEN